MGDNIRPGQPSSSKCHGLPWIPVIAVLFITAMSCSSIHPARPLKKGESLVSLSAGGPLASNPGFPIPLPNIAFDYEYGALENLTLGGNLHLVPLIIGIIYQSEIHGLLSVVEQDGWIPSLSLGLNFFVRTDFSESFLLLPELRIFPSWKLSDQILFFTGATCMLNLYPRTAGLEKKDYFLFSFPVGFEFRINDFCIAVECKILHPFVSNRGLIFDYAGLGEYGALAPFIALSYRFGGS
jgi:hypothetical protein